MKKRYIRVQPLPEIKVTKKKIKNAEEYDKEARIIALAEKLHIKIGGK